MPITILPTHLIRCGAVQRTAYDLIGHDIVIKEFNHRFRLVHEKLHIYQNVTFTRGCISYKGLSTSVPIGQLSSITCKDKY